MRVGAGVSLFCIIPVSRVSAAAVWLLVGESEQQFVS